MAWWNEAIGSLKPPLNVIRLIDGQKLFRQSYLGIRAAWRDDLKSTSAEIVFGKPLRLPGEFLTSKDNATKFDDAAEFIKDLRHHFQQIRPVNGTRHGEKKNFVFKDLKTTEYVFIRHDGPKNGIQTPYDGPYRVISRNKKTFVIDIKEKKVNY